MTVAPVPSWTHIRSFRDSNPGNLRPLSLPQVWKGQVAVDHLTGGPFAIFGSRIDGWRCLAQLLLTYQDVHGLNTVETIIGRYAPSLENDTGGYISLVCGKLFVHADQALDLRSSGFLLEFCTAIALAEGGARIQWMEAEKLTGVQLALDLPVQKPALAPKPAPTPIPEVSADDLNQQVLDGTFKPKEVST